MWQMSDGCGFNANSETLLACVASSATLDRAVAPARRSLLNVVGWRRGHLATAGRTTHRTGRRCRTLTR